MHRTRASTNYPPGGGDAQDNEEYEAKAKARVVAEEAGGEERKATEEIVPGPEGLARVPGSQRAYLNRCAPPTHGPCCAASAALAHGLLRACGASPRGQAQG